MSKEMSQRISNANYYLTIIIVLLHSSCMSYANISDATYSISKMFQDLLETFYIITVPSFFAISSYLYFCKINKNNIIKNYVKRFYSLVVPYVIWSILALLLVVFLDKVFSINSINTAIKPINYDFFSITWNIIDSTYNGPLWYVKDLIILIIISPVLLYSIKKLKWINIIFIVATFVFDIILKIDYYDVLYWLPLYYLVGYLTINNIELKTTKVIKMAIFAVFLILFLLCYYYNTSTEMVFIYRYFCWIFTYVIFSYPIFNKRLLILNEHNTFFVFCSHVWCINFVRFILIRFVIDDALVYLAMPFFISTISLIIINAICVLLKKYFPKIFSVLSGGRGNRSEKVCPN